jgi:putative acetyltransferase
MSFHIRAAEPADADDIHEAKMQAVARSFADVYGKDLIDAWKAQTVREGPDYHYPRIARGLELVAVVRGRTVGFVEWDACSVMALYVHPDFQGQGIGSALLAEGERRMPAGGDCARVEHATLSARSFYERHGYVFEGEGEKTVAGGLVFRYVTLAKRKAGC